MGKGLPKSEGIDRLLEIMARLRDPDGGCPWDQEQDFQTIAPYTIEEAYEVADAIERGDHRELREELGDLLFQVVFHAQMAREAGWFGFPEVVESVCEKMIRRHPHVFGAAQVADAAEQTRAWEAHKAEERRQKATSVSVLEGVAKGLPALTRARKLQARAARVGFDWPEVAGILDKIEEEIVELREAQTLGDQAAWSEEMGDLLFALVNLTRRTGVDPEGALRHANLKFERRFHYIETRLTAEGLTPEAVGLSELDRLWEEAKSQGL
jgi:MazG family protein